MDEGACREVEGDPKQEETIKDEDYLCPRPDPHPQFKEITVEIKDSISSARNKESRYLRYV